LDLRDKATEGRKNLHVKRASQFLIFIKYYVGELSRKSVLKPGSQTRQLQLFSQQSPHIYRAGVHKSHMPGDPSDQTLYGGAYIFGSSIWNLLHVAFLAPRIARLIFGKSVSPDKQG
jgi:hypothetical protein